MKIYSVRITNIKISNFKNTLNGNVSLCNLRKTYKASVLGIYGQNGSGKTALIDSISLLKDILTGTKIKNFYSKYINLNETNISNVASFSFDFLLTNGEEEIPVTYSFSIKADKNKIDNLENSDSSLFKVSVIDESIACPIFSDSDKRIKREFLKEDPSEILWPKSRKEFLLGVGNNSNRIDTDLIVAKELAYEDSSSFLFSRRFLKLLRDRADQLKNSKKYEEYSYYRSIFENLVNYGHYGLFVINTASSSLLSLNVQTLNFKYDDSLTKTVGRIVLPLDKESILVKSRAFNVIDKVIKNLNIVLNKIIPGLTVSVKKLEKAHLEDGEIGYKIQLLSLRNGKEIPLSFESEGIKKIISFLQLLIAVYNESSITLVVDELDSGIFEYLLGELLSIVSEKGKGQLIFTSHNLRPLETLDKGFIAFTTVNPNDRYVKLTNVKSTNNLRDMYYKNLILGEYRDDLYDLTNNSEIALAFREAGNGNG